MTGGEDATDDRDEIRAGGDELTRILRGDATDRHPRHAQRGRIAQQRLVCDPAFGFGG